MKFLFFAFAIIFSSLGFAETIQFPEVMIHQDVLGGDIILIKMKEYLVISGKESRSLEKELGVEAKRQFTRDITMTKSFSEMVELYNPYGDRPTVRMILKRYADVVTKIDSASKMN
jgi:hypothetical protein